MKNIVMKTHDDEKQMILNEKSVNEGDRICDSLKEWQ